MTNPTYVLGHSALELERLARQERLVGPATRAYFAAAGIGPSMRVLDIGSGTGLVAFHAAELVGPSGQVIGSDLSPVAVAAASEGAKARGFAHVSFRQGNPAERTFEQPFDAIVGRYVLMFQANASDMLRRVAKLLLAAQEISLPFRDAFSLTMIGGLFSTVMPSTVGGDVVKGYYVARRASVPTVRWPGNQTGLGSMRNGARTTDFSTPSSISVLPLQPWPLWMSAGVLAG